MLYEVITEVTIEIFNIIGERVARFDEGFRDPGRHYLVWDARGLPGGVYFYRLKAASFVVSKKMILLK